MVPIRAQTAETSAARGSATGPVSAPDRPHRVPAAVEPFGIFGLIAGVVLGIALATVLCGLLALLINIRDLLVPWCTTPLRAESLP